MIKDNKQIIDLTNEGLSIICKMKGINTNTMPGPNTRNLRDIIRKLYPLILKEYPTISNILSVAESKLIKNGLINVFCFSDIKTSLKVLEDIYCRQPKIFISHKSEDEAFVKALVNLLRLYIGSDAEKIFCSSVPNYKIGIGMKIFPEIKSQFEKYYVFMIIIHSPRYYQSPICLNEMGAAWIQNRECYSFLTADCEYDDLKGVIDNKIISIKVNAKDAKDRMNEFMEKVLDFFNLSKPDFSTLSQWESDRDEFLKEVCNLNSVEEQGKKAKDSQKSMSDFLSDIDRERLLEWANSEDGECWVNDTNDGLSYQIGEKEYHINSGKERVEWNDFFKRLIEIGFAAIDRSNSDGSPIYILKKPAYDYVESLKTQVSQEALSV